MYVATSSGSSLHSLLQEFAFCEHKIFCFITKWWYGRQMAMSYNAILLPPKESGTFNWISVYLSSLLKWKRTSLALHGSLKVVTMTNLIKHYKYVSGYLAD